MNILKEILQNEVFPAIGCTEPAACAYAAAVAAEHLDAPGHQIDLKVDVGTYKNGAAVVVPRSEGAKGNVIAAAMGAVMANPSARLELLRDATPDALRQARAIIDKGACTYDCLPNEPNFRVEATVSSADRSARCILSQGHASIESIQQDGKTVFHRKDERDAEASGYHDKLPKMALPDVLTAAITLDEDDRRFIDEGVRMNIAMADLGADVPGAARQLRRMHEAGLLGDDLFYRVKTRVAAAVDARMAGLPYPVMTSGGSGNQGALAILVPYIAGSERDVAPECIQESIAIAHVLNAYVKCFLGELSVVCGCALAAAIAAAGAIVYQHAGLDMPKITHAVNNVIGDLSGLICDGAKPGCTMKTVTGADAAMRAAFMAIEGFGLSDDDGVLGLTAAESIRNLGRISIEGMLNVDPTVVDILSRKAADRT
ncbi:MAG: serine dehydratase subunit alpha family protein [Phycisphaerales bacterium]|nr:serine dehydratase subunit alpha family protein [Phycisphaerales bacterium]